jgi:hypothetical protein
VTMSETAKVAAKLRPSVNGFMAFLLLSLEFSGGGACRTHAPRRTQ